MVAALGDAVNGDLARHKVDAEPWLGIARTRRRRHAADARSARHAVNRELSCHRMPFESDGALIFNLAMVAKSSRR